MRLNTTLPWIVGLVGAFGLSLWVSQPKPEELPFEASDGFSIDNEAVTEVYFHARSDETNYYVEAKRNADGVFWLEARLEAIEGDGSNVQKFRVNTSLKDRCLAKMNPFPARRIIESPTPEQLEQFGLNLDLGTLKIVTTEKTFEWKVGYQTYVGVDIFFQEPSGRVYLGTGSIVGCMSNPQRELFEARLVDLPDVPLEAVVRLQDKEGMITRAGGTSDRQWSLNGVSSFIYGKFISSVMGSPALEYADPAKIQEFPEMKQIMSVEFRAESGEVVEELDLRTPDLGEGEPEKEVKIEDRIYWVQTRFTTQPVRVDGQWVRAVLGFANVIAK